MSKRYNTLLPRGRVAARDTFAGAAAIKTVIAALREFVEDVDAVVGHESAPELQDDWPDLYITYQHAKEALAELDAPGMKAGGAL